MFCYSKSDVTIDGLVEGRRHSFTVIENLLLADHFLQGLYSNVFTYEWLLHMCTVQGC